MVLYFFATVIIWYYGIVLFGILYFGIMVLYFFCFGHHMVIWYYTFWYFGNMVS